MEKREDSDLKRKAPMRGWKSLLISSSEVSVYRGADLMTLRGTCRFILDMLFNKKPNDITFGLSPAYC